MQGKQYSFWKGSEFQLPLTKECPFKAINNVTIYIFYIHVTFQPPLYFLKQINLLKEIFTMVAKPKKLHFIKSIKFTRKYCPLFAKMLHKTF